MSTSAAPSLTLETRPGGLYLPALGLFLDPDREVARAFVSHAHGDHVGGASSGTVFASPETIALVEARRETKMPGAVPLEWGASIEMAVEREHGGGMARLSIEPAGHVLGAAQLVIDHPRGRFVYTGDYRTGPGATHAEGAPIECDTLAIETTFGLPIFSFPNRERVLSEIVAWCRETLDAGQTPVLLAYTLGKSQALVHTLFAAGLPVIAHGAVHRVCAAYESLGVPMGVAEGRLKAYVEEKKRGLGGVLIAPPTAAGAPMIKKRTGLRVGYVSGWALLDAAIEQHRADAGFVLSDHADFDDLLSVVEESGARFVYATHGEAAPFASVLNERGVTTQALQVHAIDEREEASP